MKKLNRNYLSLFEFLGLSKPDSEQPQSYSVHGFRYHDGADKDPIVLLSKGQMVLDAVYPRYQMLGALHPFVKMGKDFLDTFTPYYSRGKFKRDALQVVNGGINAAKGIVSCIGGLLALAIWLIILPFALCCLVTPLSYYARSIIPKVIYPLSWMIEGVGNIVRGITQVVTSAFTFLFKMPLRSILTFFQKEEKYAEDKPEIQRFVNEAARQVGSLNNEAVEIKRPERFEDQQALDAYNAAYAKKKECNEVRSSVAALLFEAQRKYEKSVADGWSTRREFQQDVRTAYGVMFPALTSKIKSKHSADELEPVSDQTKEDIESYISAFQASDSARLSVF